MSSGELPPAIQGDDGLRGVRGGTRGGDRGGVGGRAREDRGREEVRAEDELEDEFEGELVGGLDRALGGFVARGAGARRRSRAKRRSRASSRARPRSSSTSRPRRRRRRRPSTSGSWRRSTRRKAVRQPDPADIAMPSSWRTCPPGRPRPRARTRPRRSSARWCPSPPASSRARAGSSRATRPRCRGRPAHAAAARNPATRRFIRAMPVILQRTAQSLADQAARGRPITADTVIGPCQVAARVLGAPANRRRAVRAVGVFNRRYPEPLAHRSPVVAVPPDPEAAEPHPWRCAVTGVAAETAPRPSRAGPSEARAGTAPAAELILPSYLAGSLNVRRHLGRCGTSPGESSARSRGRARATSRR